MIGFHDCYQQFENENELIIIHIPKTGGRSLKSYIGIDPHHPHIPLKRYYLFDKKKFERFKKITMFRNPVDRLFSCFKHYFLKSKKSIEILKIKIIYIQLNISQNILHMKIFL